MNSIIKSKPQKMISTFLSTVMVASMLFGLPLDVDALEVWTPSDFTYSEADSTVITGFSESGSLKLGTNKDLVLPSNNIEGNQITAIEQAAFSKKGLTSVVIPEGIQKIGRQSFASNALTTIEIPSSVNFLDQGCFFANQIFDVNISKNVKELEISGASFANNKLKSINLPYNTKNVGPNAFKGNTGMEEELGIVYMYTVNPDHVGYNGISEKGGQKLKFIGWSSEDFTYEGTSVTGFSESGEERLSRDKDLTIPKTNTDGQKITAIAPSAFAQKGLTSVEFPEGLDSLTIGGSSFMKNEISKVIIPEGVTKIDAYAFIDNKLEEVEIPSTVFMLGNSSFKDNQISSVKISEKVNKIQIDANAFASNEMKSLELPISIEKLTKSAFMDNPGMDENPGIVYMYTTNPKHFENSRIHHMDSNIDNNRSEYQKMILKEDPEIRAIFADGILNQIVDYNTAKENLKLPEKIILNLSNGEKSEVSVTWISSEYDGTKAGDYVFAGEYNLPSGVTGEKPAVSIKITVKEEGSIPEQVEDWKATDFTYLDDCITGLSESGNTKAVLNKNLVLPDNAPDGKTITKIGSNAFNAQVIFGDVSFLKEDVISPSGFTSVKLPSSLENIGESAFQYNNFTSLNLPQGTKTIDEFAFNGNKIEVLDIPDSVIELGTSVFGVNKITKLKLSNQLKAIPNGAFTRNIKLTSVEIPYGVKVIGNSAFSGCPLNNLKLPTSVERIEKLAFTYHKMETITVPGSVKYIGEKAFSGTTKGVTLKKIILGEGIEEIGKYAFEIGLLKEVNLPTTIKTIAKDAFNKNTGCEPCDGSGGVVYLYTSNKAHLKLEESKYHKFIYKESHQQTPYEPSLKRDIVTLTGKDRYETAIKISRQGWVSADNVVLINNSSIADALSATPFAKVKDAPILLSTSENVDQQTLNEIKRLKSKNIYIVGGKTAISSDVEKYLIAEGYKVVRISGEDRYDTSLKIANELGKISKSSEIAVVNGETGLADAVSMGSVAAQKGMPIILTNKQADTNSIDEFVKNSNIAKSYVIGGKSVLTDRVDNKLKNVERIAGIDRKETNAKVIKSFYGNSLNNVYIAKNGMNRESDLIDSISVGVLAGKQSSPIMLVSGKLNKIQKELVSTKKFKSITKVGGTGNEEAFEELKQITK